MVSIIMPVFNGARFIRAAIDSIIRQVYPYWELLIINDGSDDGTEQIVRQFTDPRIHVFSQERRGVSAARNVGLKNMRGEFICFLDADDLLPLNSISSRVAKFKEDVRFDFVDGAVTFFRNDTIERRFIPDFSGPPLQQLVRLNGRAFAGPSWMIRRQTGMSYQMDESITHGEDLLFYLTISRQGGIYTYVEEEVYRYRQHDASAMRNVRALEAGYRAVHKRFMHWPEISRWDRLIYLTRMKKFMLLEYLARREWSAGLSLLVK